MERWNGKVAIVTGASSGIGRAICIKFALAGLNVLGLARNEESLRAVEEEIRAKNGKFQYKTCDVCVEEQVKEAFEYADKEMGPLHVLVNAAGVWCLGFICQNKTEHSRATIETNILSVCTTTREAIVAMAKHEVRGQIINMNSISGHEVPPLKPPIMGLYPATKYAVTAISESLSREMSYCETGIKVTSLSPGFVETGLFEKSLDASDVHLYKSRLPKPLQPDDVADAAMYILSTPDSVLIKELILTRNC